MYPYILAWNLVAKREVRSYNQMTGCDNHKSSLVQDTLWIGFQCLLTLILRFRYWLMATTILWYERTYVCNYVQQCHGKVDDNLLGLNQGLLPVMVNLQIQFSRQQANTSPGKMSNHTLDTPITADIKNLRSLQEINSLYCLVWWV